MENYTILLDDLVIMFNNWLNNNGSMYASLIETWIAWI
jgi:hypothetical protein